VEVVETVAGLQAMNNRIRVLRAERRWSQAELAERVSVSRNSVNSIENGKFEPSLPLAFRIADAFGLTIEEVFLREHEDTDVSKE
jgi:putative transcriptional regulator